MATYYITIALVTILTILAERYDYFYENQLSAGYVEHTKVTKNLYILAALVLIVVGGFRYGIGTDFFAYYLTGPQSLSGVFEALIHLDEPGIKLIYWIVQRFTSDRIVPMLVFQLITVGLMLRTIYKSTDKLFLTVLLFIFMGCWHGSFNGVRQFLAGAIVFSGLPYIRDKKFWKYALVVLIAFLFHRSAIIMIVPYFFMHNKISFRNVLFLIIGTLVVLFSYDGLVWFTEVILQSDLSRSGSYLTSAVSILRIAVAVAPAIFYLVLYSRQEKDENTTFYINMTIVHAVVMVMASQSAMLARVGIYTTPFVALAIPELNKGFERKSRIIINGVILLLYGAFFLYEVYNADSLSPFVWAI